MLLNKMCMDIVSLLIAYGCFYVYCYSLDTIGYQVSVIIGVVMITEEQVHRNQEISTFC